MSTSFLVKAHCCDRLKSVRKYESAEIYLTSLSKNVIIHIIYKILNGGISDGKKDKAKYEHNDGRDP